MRLSAILLFAVGAVVGGGAAFVLRPSPENDGSSADRRIFREKRRAQKSEIRRTDLRERLAALEAKLQETRERTTQALAPVLAAADRPFDSEAVLRYQRDNDPEAYAYQTNAVVQSAKANIASRAEDLDLLASVDTEKWDPASRAAFEEYLELTDYLTQYENKIAEMRILDPELPIAYGYDDIGKEILRKFELQFEVRQKLMAEAAKQYGLSDEDAASLADVSYRVVETTIGYNGLRDERRNHERRLAELEKKAAEAAGGQQ